MAEQERPERCETCRFWDHEGKDTFDQGSGTANPDAVYQSRCRRFPPIAGTDFSDRLVALFPMTNDYDWCGEWRANEQAAPSLLDLPLSALGLAIAPMNCLETDRRLGGPDVKTVRELVSMTGEELLAVRGFGPVCLRNVKQALARHGLRLKGDPPP